MTADEESLLRHRMMRSLESGQDGPLLDGTIAVLIIVCVIFCVVWAPAFLRRCIRGDSRGDTIGRMLVQPSEVDLAIRRMMEEQGIFIHGGALFTRSSPALGGMSLEDRRDYVTNVLRTKRVILTTQSTGPPNEKNFEDKHIIKRFKCEQNDDSSGDDDDDDDPNDIQCAICLTNYVDGDEISMAHNRHCKHVFHKKCISQWLITHEECPCCRFEYLSFNDDEVAMDENGAVAEQPAIRPVPVAAVDDNGTDDDNSTMARGMRLFYQFTRQRSPHSSTRNVSSSLEVELPQAAPAVTSVREDPETNQIPSSDDDLNLSSGSSDEEDERQLQAL